MPTLNGLEGKPSLITMMKCRYTPSRTTGTDPSVLRMNHSVLVHDGSKIIHCGGTQLTEATLKQLGITFRQMPYNLV